jgi:hypothetical protein
MGSVVGSASRAASAAAAYARIVAAAAVFEAAAKSLSALPRHSHHGDQRNRRSAIVMTAEAIWAAAGLIAAVDSLDSSELIFALGRSREPLLVEDSDQLRLPELVLP